VTKGVESGLGFSFHILWLGWFLEVVCWNCLGVSFGLFVIAELRSFFTGWGEI